MPTCKIDEKLYYIGWTLRNDVPYYNYTSVAVEYNKYLNRGYRKLGPILSPDTVDNGYSGTIDIVKMGEKYLGYYLSCTDWKFDENDTLQPCYDIKIAVSYDGICGIRPELQR